MLGYFDSLNAGTSSDDARVGLKNLNDEVIAYGNSLNGAKASAEGFNTYLASMNQGFSTAGIKAAAASIGVGLLNAAITTLAGIALTGIIVGLDYLINRSEKLQQKAKEATEAYNSAKGEFESVDSELTKTQQQIDQLNTKEKLTFVEQGELEKLKDVTKELEIQKTLAENKMEREAKDAAKANIDAYENQFGDKEFSQEKINEYSSNADLSGNNAILTSDEYDISALLAAIEQYKKLKKQALDNNDLEEADRIQTDLIEGTTDQIWEAIDTLQEYKTSLQSIPEDQRSKNVQDTLSNITDQMNFAWKKIDPTGFKNLQISEVMSTEAFSKSKDELIQLAQANEDTGITVDDIIKKFPKLSRACKTAGIDISDMASEINAIAFEENLAPDGVADLLNISDKNIRSWINGLNQNDLHLLYDIDADTSSWSLEQFKSELSNLQSSNEIELNFSSAIASTEDFTKSFSKVQETLANQGIGKNISLEQYNAEELKDYQSALQYINGTLRLNEEEVKKITKAKSEETLATIKVNDAQAKAKYSDNTQKLIELRKQLSQYKDTNDESAIAIQSQINNLLTEQDTIALNSEKYSLMAASIREATGAYQEWLNSQNAPEEGDMGTDVSNAVQAIKDVNDTESDSYMEVGTKKYKAAMEFVVPDNVPEEQVQTYVDNLGTYFKDKSGADKFLEESINKGLMQYDPDTEKLKVVAGKTMKDFASQFNWTDETVQAMFGVLNDYGGEYDWGDESFGNVNDSLFEADKNITNIQARIDELNGKKIRTPADATEIQILKQRLQEALDLKQKLSSEKVNTTIDLDGQLKTAQEKLSGLQMQQQMNIPVDDSEIQATEQEIADIIAQKNELGIPTKVEIQAAIEDTDSKITTLNSELEALNNKNYTLSVDVNEENAPARIAEIQDQLKSLEGNKVKMEVMAETAPAESAVQKVQDDEIEDKNFNVNAIDNASSSLQMIRAYLSTIQDKTITVTTLHNNQSGGASGPLPISGTHGVNGTFNGSAFANGNAGNPIGQRVLIGELGREIVVDPNTGKWRTYGDNGAEFAHIPKNAIVFNHLQSENLLERGFVTGRGTLKGGALASGNAFVGGGISYKPGGGITSGYVTNSSSSATNQNTSAVNANSQAKEDNTEKTKESTAEIDNFATRLSYFSRKTKNIIDSITDYVSSAVKSSRLKRGMAAKENEISANERSYEGYMNAANGVGLDESWKQKVRDGDYSIDTIDTSTDEGKKLQENIDKYKKYYEAALNCKDAVSQLRREQQELYTQWANVPIEAYEKKLERLGNDMDVLDAKVQARSNTNTGYLLKKAQTEDNVHLSAKKSTRNKAKTTLNKSTKSNDKIGDKLEKKVKKSKVKSSTKKKITSNIEKGRKVSTKGIKDKKLLSQIEDWNKSVGKKSKDEEAFKKADKTYQKAQGKVDNVKGVSYGYTNKLLDKEVAIQKKQNSTAQSTKKKTASIAKKTGHQLDYQKSTTKAGNKLLNDKMSKSQRKSVQKAVKSGKKVSTKGLEGNALKDAKNYNKIVADNKKNKDTTANKLLKSKGLSKSQRSAVEAGKTVSTKGLKGNDLKKAKAYNEAVKKNNEALKAQKTAADNAAKAQAELAQKMGDVANQQMENVKAFYEAKGTYLSSNTDKASKNRELKVAQGKAVTENDFEAEIAGKRNEKTNLTAQQKAMQDQFNSLVKSGKIKAGSEDWYKWQSDINGIGDAAADAEIEIQNLLDSQKNIKVTNMGYSLDRLKAQADSKQDDISKKEKKGELATADDYKQLKTNSEAQVTNLAAQNEEYKKQQQGLDVNSEKYQEIQAKIEANGAAIRAAEISQLEWNHTIENLPIEKLKKELELLDAQKSYLESIINLKKAQNSDLSKDDYESQIKKNDEEIAKQKAIKSAAEANAKKYANDPNNEYFKQYTQEALDADTAINNLEADNEELQDTMRNDIYFRGFERALEAANHLRNTIIGIGDLISEDMMYDDDGKLTDFGITKLATSVKEYESYMGDIQTIQQKIATIQGLKGSEHYSELEYTEDLRKAQEELTEAIKNGGSAREAIVNIMKSQSKAELDAIFKVIDARNKLLQKTEDYYNYDKNMKKSSKELQQLKAQAAALDGVTDAESRAQKARLDAQIKEKEEEIEDTVHEQTIKIQMDGLDELKTELQEDYDKYIKDLAQNLDKITDLINGATDIVTSSFGKVGETIQKMLESLGVDPGNFDWSGLGGAAKGGIVEKKIRSNGDSLLASVNPGETILTQDFTKILPEALFTMKAFHTQFAGIPTPKIPKIEPRGYNNLNPNVNMSFNIQSNNPQDTANAIKKEIPHISKLVIKEIAKDARKGGLL